MKRSGTIRHRPSVTDRIALPPSRARLRHTFWFLHFACCHALELAGRLACALSLLVLAFLATGLPEAHAQRVIPGPDRAYPIAEYADPMEGLVTGESIRQFDFLGGGWIDLHFRLPEAGAKPDAESTYEIVIRARGDPALGEDPEMELRIADARIGITKVAPSWQDYRFLCRLRPGTHTLRIFFTNDYYQDDGEIDRNLRLDTFLIRKVAGDEDEILRRAFTQKYPQRKILWIKLDPWLPGRRWVGVEDGFVVLFNVPERTFVDFYECFRLLKQTPPSPTAVLLTDASVWVGTRAGLFEYDRKTASLEAYAPGGKRFSVEALSQEGDKLLVDVKGKPIRFDLRKRRWLDGG